MCTKTVLDRVRELRDNNPDIADTLELKFPEIVDNEPFIGDSGKICIFMRRGKPSSLYGVVFHENHFKIINLNYLKFWKGAAHSDGFNRHFGNYMTKSRFSKLLKSGGEKLENIRFIPESYKEDLYIRLFN